MRDNSVSIAKAFAIMLMVLAHTWFMDMGNKWINMFPMPLFFFMAGYCFKDIYRRQHSNCIDFAFYQFQDSFFNHHIR